MSTNPTVPSDPQAMPLEDLKTAAGLSGTPAPVVDPPSPPPAPVVPEAYTVSQDDNGVTITLSPEFGGEVYKGKDATEALGKLAKAKADANAYIKQLKTQPVAPPAPVPSPAAPQESPEEIAARDWILDQQAKALGLTKDQYLARVNMVFETSERMAVNSAFADFAQACPDYADTPENAGVLATYFPENMDHFPSARELKIAWAMARYEGKGQATPAARPQTTRLPPPTPSATGSQPQSTQGAWDMPLDQLRAAAFQK